MARCLGGRHILSPLVRGRGGTRSVTEGGRPSEAQALTRGAAVCCLCPHPAAARRPSPQRRRVGVVRGPSLGLRAFEPFERSTGPINLPAADRALTPLSVAGFARATSPPLRRGEEPPIAWIAPSQASASQDLGSSPPWNGGEVPSVARRRGGLAQTPMSPLPLRGAKEVRNINN